MATKIIMTVDAGLSVEEQADLKYLLSDALGEFAARRTPALEYVKNRYPDEKIYYQANDKLAQVERRNDLACKLHNAALTFDVTHPVPGIDLELLEEMAASGERRKVCMLLLQDLFEMSPDETRVAYNWLEDARITRKVGL